MTNNMQKIHSLLGIAMRAGKLVSGEDGTMIDLKKGKLNLVIVAEDASNNTKKLLEKILIINDNINYSKKNLNKNLCIDRFLIDMWRCEK